MRKTLLHSFSSPYRADFHMYAYDFTGGLSNMNTSHIVHADKSCAIVGALRGNDVAQLFAASLVVNKLAEFEEKGYIIPGKNVTVVPCVNHYAMNAGKKFCTKCNHDINRHFPGQQGAENVDRLAHAVWNKVNGYENGVQIAADIHANGSFITHVMTANTPLCTQRIKSFNLPHFVHNADNHIADADNTLISSWLGDGTTAFSLYTNEVAELDVDAAEVVLYSIMNFLLKTGIITDETEAETETGSFSQEIERLRKRRGIDCGPIEFKAENLVRIYSPTGGLYKRIRNTGERVKKGDLLAQILHPYEGRLLADIISPGDGLLFFACRRTSVIEKATVFMLSQE